MAVVRFDFMARCLSAGNDSGFIKLIDPDQHRHLAPNQAQADEALLPIVLTVLLPGYHRKIERVVAVGEIYLMLAKVRLGVAPFPWTVCGLSPVIFSSRCLADLTRQ